MNTIFIHDLRVSTRIGVYAWERELAQTVRLDIELAIPSTAAFGSDDFSDALDYAAIVARLKTLAADHPHHLLERFAQAVADVVLGEFGAPWVRVRVAKLAPIAGVKELGVQIALDDFGTGYSSLSYLHRFPVDIVKVDRAFVSTLQANGDGSAVATAVMHMAHALGLIAAAEGVEAAGQLAGLRALGCDWAQGFLFAEPLPSDEFGELLARAPRW
jgi:FolB domain-containing protein